MASGPGSSSSDQRRSPRVGAPKAVVRVPSADRFRSHYLKDVSEGGLFIKAEKLLPVGTELVLELWPPGGVEPLSLRSRVVRTISVEAAGPQQTPGMAVTFIDLAPATQVRLRELIASYSQAEPEPEGDSGDPFGQVQRLLKDLAKSRERIVELTGELSEARKLADTYAEQARRLEADEATARKIAKQQGAERALLQEQVRKLESEVAKIKEGGGQRGFGEGEGLRDQLTRMANELSAAHLREQELGKLLGGARPKVAPQRGQTDPEEASFEEVTVDDGPRLPPPPPDADMGELVDGAVDLNWSDSDSKTEAPVLKQAAASDDLDSFLNVIAEETPGEDFFGDLSEPELQTSIVDGRIGFEQFSKTLVRATRLLPTDRLHARKPASVDEALISELVKASPTFGTLLNQLGGQVREDRMRQLLYEMYARGLLDLRDY